MDGLNITWVVLGLFCWLVYQARSPQNTRVKERHNVHA